MLLFGKYQKTVTALVTGEIGWAGVVIAASHADSFHVTPALWLAQAVVWAVALGVYAMPNMVTTVAVEPPVTVPANWVVMPNWGPVQATPTVVPPVPTFVPTSPPNPSSTA